MVGGEFMFVDRSIGVCYTAVQLEALVTPLFVKVLQRGPQVYASYSPEST